MIRQAQERTTSTPRQRRREPLAGTDRRDNPFVLPTATQRPVVPSISPGARAALRSIAEMTVSPRRRPVASSSLPDPTTPRAELSSKQAGTAKANVSTTATVRETTPRSSRNRHRHHPAVSAVSGSSTAAGATANAAALANSVGASADGSIAIGRTYFAGAYYITPAPQRLDRTLTRMTIEMNRELAARGLAVDAAMNRRELSALSPRQLALLQRADAARSAMSAAVDSVTGGDLDGALVTTPRASP